MLLHIPATYITTFLDRDNVTPVAIASASALFKTTCAQSYDASRPRASLIYRRSLQYAVLLFIVLHYSALYPSCVINTRIAYELTRYHINGKEKRRVKDGVIGGLKTEKLIRILQRHIQRTLHNATRQKSCENLMDENELSCLIILNNFLLNSNLC